MTQKCCAAEPFALKECREGKRILITVSKLPAFSQSGLFNIMSSGQPRNDEKLPALSVVLHRRLTILSRADFCPDSTQTQNWPTAILYCFSEFIHILPVTPLPTHKAALKLSDLKAGHKPSCSTWAAAHPALRSQQRRFSQLPAGQTPDC